MLDGKLVRERAQFELEETWAITPATLCSIVDLISPMPSLAAEAKQESRPEGRLSENLWKSEAYLVAGTCNHLKLLFQASA